MTPNTSDRPEAIRNRNIAVVRPPRNCPNRSETSSIAKTFAIACCGARLVCRRGGEGAGENMASSSNAPSRRGEGDSWRAGHRAWENSERRQLVYGPCERYFGFFMVAKGKRSSLTIWPQNS